MANVHQDVSTADRTLPENDGMYLLRHELQEIRMLAISTEEKARRMHELMMKDYMARRFETDPPSSPSFPYGGDADGQVHSSPPPDVDPQNPYNIQPGDVDPTFSPLSINPQELEGGLEDESDEELVPDLGCVHYKRNVKLQCFDCRRWFTCRHCHDLSTDLPFPHLLNRKQTQNMLCMLCQTPQPASEVCLNCGEYAAWYYCPKCKLWDNDSNKRIYHCDDCGICRVGEGLGKDFVHCRRCNVCISISTADAHPCVERATEGNCPLCLVPLFESRTPVVSLPCGHYMHGTCYKELMAVTYKCPVCSKSAVNMEIQWRKLDDAIQVQPMPKDDEDLDGLLPHAVGGANTNVAGDTGAVTTDSRQQRPKAVWIACNDCGGRSWTPFHWLGLKCQTCDSYNTNQMAPSAGHESEAERMIRQNHLHQHHNFTGNAALRDAGITDPDTAQRADSALDVPHSPSNQPSSPPMAASTATTAAATAATTPHSPGRYFVRDEAPRRPSFTGPRFSAPSMATLPSLADMPRIPRMPNIELPRFSPYEMINAVSRSLSPMRYYLQGLDLRDDEPVRRPTRPRPKSVQSEPFRSPLGPQLRPRSAGSVELHSWDEETFDTNGNGDGREGADDVLAEDADRSERGSLSGDSDDEEGSEDEEDGDPEGEDDGHGEIDIFGHP